MPLVKCLFQLHQRAVWLLFQVPAGNNGQAAAGVPPDRPPDNLALADPQQAENLGDEAEPDDEDDREEEGEEDVGMVQDGNNGGQGESDTDCMDAEASL